MSGGGRVPVRCVAGPFFDELELGRRVVDAPSITLDEGLAATHRSILGTRFRLALDRNLARRVTGEDRRIADPSLVWDIAIGQSTILTQRVIANLFYRGLAFTRMPRLGDTLSTTAEVVALKQNATKEGKAATGLAALRIVTTDQEDRAVLDFHRCAMLPLADPQGSTGHRDDMSAVGRAADGVGIDATSGWDLGPLRSPAADEAGRFVPGRRWEIASGDVVSAAPELARLSLNIAAAHHDAAANAQGRRLVYGGHVIGLAAAQVTRAIPEIAAIVAWHSCDHLAPVAEGDTLTSVVELEEVDRSPAGQSLSLRSRVEARATGAADPVAVLDWRFVALVPAARHSDKVGGR
ncbi:MAG: acyl dehydratase [Actinobacteria bacterium]|nr:acyl dehydratase [Actinomycetota bacterium]